MHNVVASDSYVLVGPGVLGDTWRELNRSTLYFSLSVTFNEINVLPCLQAMKCLKKVVTTGEIFFFLLLCVRGMALLVLPLHGDTVSIGGSFHVDVWSHEQ